MTTAAAHEAPSRRTPFRTGKAEVGLAAMLLALGAFLLVETSRIDIPANANSIGPRFFPTVVGVVLLGGEYARFSFPYKTMSLIERGYPVLCFADMGIADFLERNRVGLGVARSSEAIRAGIDALVRDGAPGMTDAQRTQSWAARLSTARAAVGLDA